MYRRILVPIDGSATSDRGFEEAVALGRALGSSLHLMHVVDTYPVAVEMVTATTWQEISAGLRQQGQSILDRARQAAVAHGLSADLTMVESPTGRVADAILRESRDADCDLIVMGTHGRRGFTHVMMGSDAERVVRESTVPVLLVRHPEARRA